MPGAVAVLVGADLVQALESSPLGSLDLAAAAQPALDAAAAAFGAKVAAARTVPIELAINDLGYPFTLVPLVGDGGSAAPARQRRRAPAPRSAPPPPRRSHLPQPRVLRGPRDRAGAVGQRRPWPGDAARRDHGRHRRAGTRPDERARAARAHPGTVLELDRAAGSPADLLVNGRLIARGEVVVIDEDFGLRVTEIVDDAAAS